MHHEYIVAASAVVRGSYLAIHVHCDFRVSLSFVIHESWYFCLYSSLCIGCIHCEYCGGGGV